MTTRPDGRQLNQLRDISIQRGFTDNPAGSVLVTFGNTKVLTTASIEERVPKHILVEKEDGHGWLTAEYSLLPASTHDRVNRERYKVSGRTMEIQRLIGRCLRASIDLPRMGTRTITVDADVLQADGGTRVAAITGAYVAVVDALNLLIEDGLLGELPIVSPIAAVSVGLFEGDVLLDLNYDEDVKVTVDANVVMNARGELVEFQATSEGVPFSREAMFQMVDVAHQGIEQLLAIQQEALAQPLHRPKVGV